jgi:hypothetical protein
MDVDGRTQDHLPNVGLGSASKNEKTCLVVVVAVVVHLDWKNCDLVEAWEVDSPVHLVDREA